jgi:23S rRNA (guanosine2251-2'-O)-methyltransferase
MSRFTFEIRVCTSCSLRYPIMQDHPFGTRCPQCLGETQVVVKKSVKDESGTRRQGNPKRSGRIAVLLDNIRSAWNVGSILRSADGFGFEHVYLCGITPTPESEAVRKTSLGAEEFVAWSHNKDAVKLVERLKAEGWKVCGLEEDARSKPLLAGKHENRNTLLIVGSEATGVDPGLLELCEEIYFIPMSGEKHSFNAAVAFGIAAFALVEQQ